MMVSSQPKVSILMPVYNGAVYLSEAIQSILDQTFTDFEFLIIDDGSSDDSYSVAASFSDVRIRLIRNNKNLGLVASLNTGLELARGEYIARMDADDISLPDRLSRQVDFMDAHPDVSICGSWLLAFSGNMLSEWHSPLSHNKIHARLLFQSALFHPTVLIRMSLIISHQLRYRNDFPYAEDYELWSRSQPYGRYANIGEILLRYRIHDKSIGSNQYDAKQKSADRIRLRWLQSMGLSPTDDEIHLHRELSLGMAPDPVSMKFLERAHAWLLKIRTANAVTKVFPEPELSEELSERWFVICNKSVSCGHSIMNLYFSSPLSAHFTGTKRAIFAFIVKCLLRWSGRYCHVGTNATYNA